MGQPSTEQSPKPGPKEPGNRLGAAGLLASVVGAGSLAFEVPPELLTLDARVGWGLLTVGLFLLGAGLVAEWSGPRRWSAVLPAVFALGFGGWAFSASAAESLQRCAREVLRLEGVGAVGWTCRRDEAPRAIALLVETPWARGVPALARGLAERGIVPFAVDPVAWAENPDAVLPAVAEAARREYGVPLGVVSWGETARQLPNLTALVDAEFSVALSVSALEPIDRLSELDEPSLFAFGVEDPTYAGHGHASAMVDAVGSQGIRSAAIRVFLGADRDLLVPVARPSIQPTRLANGWLDLLSDWIYGATSSGRST